MFFLRSVMFSMMSNAESSPTTSSPFGFGSSSASPFSAPQTPDLDDERSIYMSPTPVSRSLKADNVKEIYFKAYVDEKLEVHKKELEEGDSLDLLRFTSNRDVL
ncbi:hypothetical protein Y032_0091g2476 [Ancylostoma ceylanicum]|nr:hypothetical protein Y032_0091g2476 [Ancylostoma ceylanicum]